jgi:hypothetical protein
LQKRKFGGTKTTKVKLSPDLKVCIGEREGKKVKKNNNSKKKEKERKRKKKKEKEKGTKRKRVTFLLPFF